MNIITYILIFIFKIIEDALSTLRLIVINNGKKVLGAYLSFIVTLIWIILTGTVLIGLQKDIMKAIAFALGSLFGSYLGSLIEEKLALGTILIITEIDKEKAKKLIKKISKDYQISKMNCNNKVILMITSPRKKSKQVINIIKTIDNKATILSEKVKIIPM